MRVSDPLDLTGSWDGVFNYPRGLPPNGFRAALREHGGAVDGETHERSEQGADRGRTITALLTGSRTGTSVHLTKRYDSLHRTHYAVVYEGRLSADGDEITGRWSIPGIWEGTFLMVRQARKAATTARRVSETVDG